MIVAVFRSRLAPDHQSEYAPMAARMSELARTVPGYISHKTFAAEDGERVTVVEFESQAALRAWASHPDHMLAKKQGIERFFSAYSYRICDVVHSRGWSRVPGVGE